MPKRLPYHAWLCAWDKYAIGAAITEQLSFSSAMTHKEVVCEIAAASEAEGRKFLLAILYDELAK